VIIPLGTDRPLARTPIVTWGLVALLVVIHVALAALGRLHPNDAANLVQSFALAPAASPWYTYLTYALLHGGFLHLVGNVLILAVFGPNVEDRLGKPGFIALLALGAVVAGALHITFENAGVIGASGAIAAVTGAYLVMFPRTLVRVFYFLIIFGVTMFPAWVFIAFAITKDVLLTGLGLGGSVATLAHIGGYALGTALAATLLATGLIKPETYDLFSMAKQAKRRADFRAAARLAQSRGTDPAFLAPKPATTTASTTDAHPTDPLPHARAQLARAVSTADWSAAQQSLASLLALTAGPTPAASLTPGPQQALANALFTQGHHAHAADAYEAFLAAHPRDAGAHRVRLMLALITARYLNQPDRARKALSTIDLAHATQDEQDLLQQLRAQLAAP
jgi:membrane associated rhomboid family serine protease